MSNLAQPDINVDVTPRAVFEPIGSQRVLLITEGRGSLKNGDFWEDIQEAQVNEKMGEASLAALAFRRFRKYDPKTIVDYICLKPKQKRTKTSGEGSITVTGTATASGQLTVAVADDEFTVYLDIAKNETAEQIVTKIADSLEAMVTPFDLVRDNLSNGVLKFTFGVTGSVGSWHNIVAEGTAPGVEFSVISFTQGSDDFDTDGVLDKAVHRYQTVIFDSSISYHTVEAWLRAREEDKSVTMAGAGFTMIPLDYIASGFLADELTKRDWRGHTITMFMNFAQMRYTAIPILMVAEFCAKRTLRLTPGANISKIVISSEESVGGPSLASLPYHNTPMSYRPPKGRITREEMDAANKNGFSVMGVRDGKSVITGVYTMVQEGETNVYRYLEGFDTGMIIHEYLQNNLLYECGQKRLTRGPKINNRAVENARSLKSIYQQKRRDLINMLLIDGGEDAEENFLNKMELTIDHKTGMTAFKSEFVPVGQLRGVSAVIPITNVITSAVAN